MTQYRFLQPPDDQTAQIPDSCMTQITRLYREAGWWDRRDDNPAHIRRIIDGSHFFLIAVENDQVIGMGRVISDRASDAYIQDVTVLPSRRENGIGSQIVSRLVDQVEKAGLMWIGLIAERNTAQLYERIGFQKMPDSTPMKKNESFTQNAGHLDSMSL